MSLHRKCEERQCWKQEITLLSPPCCFLKDYARHFLSPCRTQKPTRVPVRKNARCSVTSFLPREVARCTMCLLHKLTTGMSAAFVPSAELLVALSQTMLLFAAGLSATFFLGNGCSSDEAFSGPSQTRPIAVLQYRGIPPNKVP